MAELSQYEKTDYYVLGRDDYFTAENLRQAKNGEKGIYSALRLNHKKSEGWEIGHNSFDSQYYYCCGSGRDLCLFDLHDPDNLFLFEVKSLSPQDRPYGTDFVIIKVLPRFDGADPNAIKILVITYLNLLTKEALALLAKHHIFVFEIGFVITPDIYAKENIRELYCLGDRLHDFIEQVTPQPKQLNSYLKRQTQLSDVLNQTEPIFSTSKSVNTPNRSNALPLQHDTPIHTDNIPDYENDPIQRRDMIERYKKAGLYYDYNG